MFLGRFRVPSAGYTLAMADQPYADPQDLQFGKIAAQKEETLDELLEEGMAPERIEAADERQNAVVEPRPGGKAEPAGSSD
jgi:hypothetical protein